MWGTENEKKLQTFICKLPMFLRLSVINCLCGVPVALNLSE
jgi:hypothetical protein